MCSTDSFLLAYCTGATCLEGPVCTDSWKGSLVTRKGGHHFFKRLRVSALASTPYLGGTADGSNLPLGRCLALENLSCQAKKVDSAGMVGHAFVKNKLHEYLAPKEKLVLEPRFQDTKMPLPADLICNIDFWIFSLHIYSWSSPHPPLKSNPFALYSPFSPIFFSRAKRIYHRIKEHQRVHSTRTIPKRSMIRCGKCCHPLTKKNKRHSENPQQSLPLDLCVACNRQALLFIFQRISISVVGMVQWKKTQMN